MGHFSNLLRSAYLVGGRGSSALLLATFRVCALKDCQSCGEVAASQGLAGVLGSLVVRSWTCYFTSMNLLFSLAW